MSSSSRKRPQTRKDERYTAPAFWDATASVSAAQFGARRLPEIKQLWWDYNNNNNNKNDNAIQALASAARKSSSRHLRRRATSHKPRNRYRRWNNDTSNQKPPPSLVASKSATRSRKVQRKISVLLQSKHETWRYCSTKIQDQDDSCTASTTTTASTTFTTHWMTTHVWHAKRFRMQRLWNGWMVPVLHSNRGANAALRLAATTNNDATTSAAKCLIQDVTFRMQPIWFRIDTNTASSTTTTTTTTTVLNDFQQAVRRLIPDFSIVDYQNNNNKTAFVSGEAMLHDIDCFPNVAVGTVLWIQRTQPLLNTSSKTNETTAETTSTSCARISTPSEVLHVYFFVHPSIQETTLRKLANVSNNKHGAGLGNIVEGPFFGVDGGVACFRLRGKNATSCLSKAIGHRQAAMSDILDDLEASSNNDNNIHCWIDKTQNEHGSLLEVSETTNRPTATDSTSRSCGHNGSLVLRSVQPRDPSLPCNWAVCGLDVICDPSRAKELFLSLVEVGGACPIGITEEAYLALECDPPLPIFPRDYPDAQQGLSYWSSSLLSLSSSSTSTFSDEWSYVRQHWEGGGGRIRRPTTATKDKPQYCCRVLWSDLIAPPRPLENAPTTACPVVMVRGPFVNPFRDALSSAGTLPVVVDTNSGQNAKKKMRRYRRPARSPSRLYKQSQFQSEQVRSAHQERCFSLCKGLALPALLLCHVQVSGKGALKPGMPLYSMEDGEEALAIVTAGSFSISRGRCHGLCIAGAARFLKAVSAPQPPVVVQRLDGTSELQLKVRWKAKTRFCEGTLKLLATSVV